MDIGRNNYALLLEKLDGFTRKYYSNQIIRGSLWFGAIMLTLFLLLNVLEYQFYFTSSVRTILFYGFLLLMAILFYAFIFQYVLKYFRLGKLISHEHAAVIIGNHFSNVQDKLINILQLKNELHDFGSIELINASINQKINELHPIPFVKAIDFGKNKKYLKYALPPLVVILFLLIAAPNLIKESTKHYVQHDTHFERKAPFEFVIDPSNPLRTIQFADYALKMRTEGNFLPREVNIVVDDFMYKMKSDSGYFGYDFKNVQKDVKFHFEANGFTSREFILKVIPKPIIAGFDITLRYPAYTGNKQEVLRNIGDLSVPIGTEAIWRFNTEFVDELKIKFGNEWVILHKQQGNVFSLTKRLKTSMPYTLKVFNKEVEDFDSVSYVINVIPDLYPTIRVMEYKDTANTALRYYTGDVSDDYGISKVLFHSTIERKDSLGKLNKIVVSRNVAYNGSRAASFMHTLSLKSLGLLPGDELTYYFEVWDNDGIQGPKSARSVFYSYKMPSLSELEKQTEENNKEIKKDFQATLKEAKKLQQEAKELREKLLEKKNMDWNDKKNIEKVLEKQKALEKQVEQMRNEVQQNFDQQKEFKEQDQRILDKQQQLQDLMKDLFNPEMKELYRQLEELMEQMDKEKMMENLEKMEMKNEKLEKELDRMLELFKNLEYNQKMEETSNKLEQLAKEQEKLANETEKGITEELKKKQDELNKKMEDAKKDIDELNKMNQEKNKGKEEDFKDIKQDANEADKNQEDAQDEMQQGNKQGASKKQKEAAKKMRDAADKMKKKTAQQQSDQQEEDFEMLRRLLENLLYLSFEQEKLVHASEQTPINTPAYVKNIQVQNKLKDDFKLVEDTLYALAARQDQIKKFVFDEVDNIKTRTKKAIKFLVDRNVGQGIVEQQSVMMHYNNLTLMLSEVMTEMQEDEKEQKSGQCNNPSMKKGKKKSNANSLSQMQKQLNKQLKDLQDKMGQKPGQKEGQKPGDMPKPGQGGRGQFSKEMAQIAAQQQAIRRALKELDEKQNKAGKDGKKPLGDLGQMMKEMERTETELVNKRLTEELLRRQKEIEVKLLEAANAERTQEEEKKRESKTAEEIPTTIPPALEEYMRKRQQEIDLIRKTPVGLKPFYKRLVEKYYEGIK